MYPRSLDGIFPWCHFYEGSMEAFIAKEEHVAGMYGIEGRYPYLDKSVVQEFLWLTQDLKNRMYKAPLDYYMRMANYPFELNVKRGFKVCSKHDRVKLYKMEEEILGRKRSDIKDPSSLKQIKIDNMPLENRINRKLEKKKIKNKNVNQRSIELKQMRERRTLVVNPRKDQSKPKKPKKPKKQLEPIRIMYPLGIIDPKDSKDSKDSKDPIIEII
jgi:hypothetical protein